MGNETVELTDKDRRRFWSKVERGEGCWLWTGALNRKPNGYGMFTVCRGGVKRRIYAHRLAFEMEHGPIPVGEQILHTCDVPRCVRPSHLRAGTHLENISEMWARGRANRRRAEACGVTLLVRRTALAQGFENWRSLQERTGLPEGTVEGLWSNKTVWVDIGALGRIADVLGVKPGDLIGRAA